MLLQHFFQCSCPPISEEARYPRQVDVIISACEHLTSSRLSPSGRFLYVYEETPGLISAYRLDLQTMERTDVAYQPFSSFLTDDLWFVENGIEDYIIDQTTGKRYPIRTFRYWQENAYVNGEPNLELLISSLHRAERVFLTPNYSTVVVLMPNFFANPAQGFTFDLSDFPEWGPRRVEQFLQEDKVIYQTVLANFPHEVVSPDGKLIAQDDGIYLFETNQRIAKAPPSLVRGWTSNSRGAIYSSDGRCLIRRSLPFADDVGCEIWVPQPVLLLKIPEEYLPEKTP